MHEVSEKLDPNDFCRLKCYLSEKKDIFGILIVTMTSFYLLYCTFKIILATDYISFLLTCLAFSVNIMSLT